jgi:D-beta-D-heptose 7-phosphate kinase/D-beta-D-heptose 1-phosphate adenosyltransferase
MTSMPSDLIEMLNRLGEPRVLVVGDLMLDRYVWGDAARISQEAPVILLRADHREERLGGASSVATMLRALGAKVALAGVIGADADGGRIRQMLARLGAEQDAVLTDAGRPTTVKERYIGRAQQKHPQQILRVDYERRDAVNTFAEQDLAQRIASEVRRADAVLISDYDKGVCTPGLLAAVIAGARECDKPVLADPARGGDYAKYRGCSAITPNRLEASLATGRQIVTTAAALEAAAVLRDALDLEAAIVTLDKDGIALAGRTAAPRIFPTRPRQVYDIAGAGDMVLSVLGLALASGAGYEDAIRLANIAGALEVEKVGVATVTRDEIRSDLLHETAGADGSAKLVKLPDLLAELEHRHRAGQRVAFANGCFDVLHAGHVQYLREARSQADLLVVGLNSDASVRALKGPDRPVNPVDARADVLAGLQAVDFVAVFAEPTPLEMIRAIRPDVLVKGADYRKDGVVGAEFVESYGGRVHLAALREGVSGTKVRVRMRAA